MRKIRRPLTFALAALLAVAVRAEPVPAAEQALLDSASHWQAEGREDLALVALQKLALVHPDDPRLQLRLGMLELRTNRMADAAKRLAALQKTHPQDEATQELADEYRVATRDRLRMASARRLAQIGEYGKALAAFKELFPEGPPHGALGEEYVRILGKAQGSPIVRRAGHPGAKRSQAGRTYPVPVLSGRLHLTTALEAGADQSAVAEEKVAMPAPADDGAAMRQRVAELRLSTHLGSVASAGAAGIKQLDLVAQRDADAQRWSAAETIYRSLLQLDPADLTAVAGLAKVLGATERWQEALDMLSAFVYHYPMAAGSVASGRAGILGTRADAEVRTGQFDAARTDLEMALGLSPADPWLRLDLARLDARQGMVDRGQVLMNDGEALAPADWDMRYAHALYLSATEDRRGALSLLSTIPAAQRTAGMLRLDQRLRLELAAARADELAKAGDWPAAGAEYEGLLRDHPGDLDLRLAYARLLQQSGHRDAALAILSGIARDATPEDTDHRLAAARQLLALGDAEGAQRCIATLRASAPNNIDALLLAGDIAGRGGRRGEAFDDFEKAGSLARAETAPAGSSTEHQDAKSGLVAAEDAAAELTRARPAYVSGALDAQVKPGDPGISRFRDFESPVELRMLGPAAGTLMVQIDPVQASAGRLPADFAIASQFGKVLAFGPGSLKAFPGGADQMQSGAAFGAGYYSEHYRLDLGSTPIGFLVQNIAGGGEIEQRLGPFDGALGFSRRPVNSTLLSYAGARDPVTGEVWGGVMKTGLNVGLGHYEAQWGANASAGYYRLDGRKVLGNNEVAARASAYRLLYDSRNMDLSLGLSATYWSYDRNLRYYSFGQGGYYSPQSYLAFGLPLDWEGRTGRLAYELRAVVSKTLSHENRSPYYPTDPLLQQQAGNPYYSGGSGSGIGYDVRGNLEYQLDRHWFLGGRFEIDRSAFYSPDFLTLYFRYEFTPHWWPIAYPPRAPLPYTQY